MKRTLWDSISEYRCNADGFYPDETDCTVFYECHHGQTTRLLCAPGLGYRTYLRTCDLIEYVPHCKTTKEVNTDRVSEMTNQDGVLSGGESQVANQQEVLSDVPGVISIINPPKEDEHVQQSAVSIETG